MDNLMISVKRRLASEIRTWPRSMSEELRQYLESWREKQDGMRRKSADHRPYWIFLPSWLWACYRKSGLTRNAPRNFLHDVLWAQYCLFLSIRMQDDLFDGQANSQPLIFVSDQLLVEAERVFAFYFENSSRFWEIERNCFQTTLQAIVCADKIQRSPTNKPQSLLNEYARISAVFKIGSGAVCVKAGQISDFARVSAFADELAIVSQILDDLEDVVEDMQRKRYNYVASLALSQGEVKESHRVEPLEQIAQNLLLTNFMRQMSAVIRLHLDRAAAAIAPLEIPEVMKYFEVYRKFVKGVEESLHRTRVNKIFGK